MTLDLLVLALYKIRSPSLDLYKISVSEKKQRKFNLISNKMQNIFAHLIIFVVAGSEKTLKEIVPLVNQ